MPIKLANNASTRLALPITSSATTITSEVGGGTRFPVTINDVYFPMTLVAADGSLEIVKCTARAGDNFTVERAQEGTIAKDFTAGSVIELRFTAGAMEAVVAELDDTIEQAKLDLEDQIAGAEGFGVGDYLTTKRDPGENWLRRNGSIYDKNDYPLLSAYFPTLPHGIVWSETTPSSLTISPDPRCTRRLSNGYVLVCGPSPGGSAIQISEDGCETFRSSIPISYNNGLNFFDAAYGNGVIVLTVSTSQGGGAPTNHQGRAYVSTDDGYTFSSVTVGSATSLSGITYFNGVFIAFDLVGGKTFTSPNGVTWTQRASPVTGAGNAYTDGSCMFVQDSGTLYVMFSIHEKTAYTTNGTTWTQTTDYVYSRQKGVGGGIVFKNGYFCAVTQSNEVKITQNPKTGTWSTVTTGASTPITGIAEIGSLIVITAGTDTFMSSNGGQSWQETALTNTAAIGNIVTNTDGFSAVSTLTSPTRFLVGEIPETDLFQVPSDDATMDWIKAK